MEPRTDDKKTRFQISKLEPRLAPGTAGCGGLLTALAAASPHVDPAQVEFVVGIVTDHNPQSDC